MQLRLTGALVLSCSIAACSSGAGVGTPTPLQPAAAASRAAATSAVRVPPSALAATQHKLSLETSPFPLRALAWPLRALAWPLRALAWQGGSDRPGVGVCKDADKGNKHGHGHNRGAKCRALLNADVALNPDPQAPPSAIGGVQPGLLNYIYNLPGQGGDGQTVAFVVAYDNPQAESDLAIYRSAFGLPACTTANGCFRKLPGSGSQLPKADAGWSVESSVDLDAVSAACSHCKLLLVEAASDMIPDLATAVDTAVASGATVVANSYGVDEASDNVAYASHYNHPGVPMTAAAGDVGFGVQFPASVPAVTAVGGTSVQQIGDDSIQEVVWPLTGAGCSAFFAKPAWQHDAGCPGRTVNDVAMVADPADGISVYDSTLPGTERGGWSAFGGTSVGASLVAALYALAANGSQLGSNAGIYAAATAPASGDPLLINVTSGNDGTCAIAYLCTAGAGFNGPTGNGVPWGVGAFAPTK